jgi:hypothetical protein
MKRTFRILMAAIVMAAMTSTSIMPAFAQPKAGAGCKGLVNAIAKQTAKRPGGANPALVQKAADRGCIAPESPPVEG